ncbi:MAG: NAD(P)H-dependent oxidoreductase [Sulfitobacter sp.]
MSKRIYILNGHPADTSLNRALAESYATAARAAGHEVRLTHIAAMDFDIDFGRAGYSNPKPLETELETMLEDIVWAQHFVLTTPMWWGGIPAKLKGAIDRAFLPGRTFDGHVPKGKMPKPLLTGRTARVIVTSDTPKWFVALIYRNAIVHQLRGHILRFVGIKPTKVSFFAAASKPEAGKVDGWLTKVAALGKNGA